MKLKLHLQKIYKLITKLRHAPIEVIEFHAVSDSFDPEKNTEDDWISTEEFKYRLLRIKETHQFISLVEATKKLKRDFFRSKKYAVLTCDDGYHSVLSIIPFLLEQEIPLTLFINAKYLDGKSKRDEYAPSPEYISFDELMNLDDKLITIGMHGYEHKDATKQSDTEFIKSIEMCKRMIIKHKGFIPYFAYPWGFYSKMNQKILKEMGIVPVFSNGAKNYTFKNGINRRIIEDIPQETYRN